MNLQYISDSNGQTTGVFIPIQDWEYLTKRLIGLDKDEFEITYWQAENLRRRIESCEEKPNRILTFNRIMDEIISELDSKK